MFRKPRNDPGVMFYDKAKVLSIGKNIVQGLWNGISQADSWLWGKINGWANSILSKIEGAFGIGSPSELMRDEVGRWLTVGMAKGIEKEEKAAVDEEERCKRYEHRKYRNLVLKALLTFVLGLLISYFLKL